MGADDSTLVLADLLGRIRAAHEAGRAADLPPLVSAFISAAARRLEALAHRVIRKHAPARAGETAAVLGAAYERLAAALGRHPPPATPADYFHIAAAHLRHALLDLIRADARAARNEPLPPETPADSTAPPERVGRTEFWERFLGEVERLRPDLRRVFDLHWTQGLSHADCGAELGLTEKQARTRWEEVKVTLARRLGGFPADP